METTTKYAYEKLMADEKLTMADLSKDAKVGIEAIKNIEKAIAMAEKKGKTINQSTYDKLEANDRWVVREIIDMIDDTDKNDDDLPNPAKNVINDINNDEGQGATPPATAQINTTPDPKGIELEKELVEMHKTGIKDWKVEDLKAKYKQCYDVLFDAYEDGAENGLETTNYSLIENSNGLFTLTKK